MDLKNSKRIKFLNTLGQGKKYVCFRRPDRPLKFAPDSKVFLVFLKRIGSKKKTFVSGHIGKIVWVGRSDKVFFSNIFFFLISVLYPRYCLKSGTDTCVSIQKTMQNIDNQAIRAINTLKTQCCRLTSATH